MSISTAALTRLAALHLAPEAMQEVIAIIVSCIEPLETRRQRDRDRKRGHGKSEDNPRNICGNSTEIPLEIPPHKIPPPVSSKRKNVSRSPSIDVPETISDDQLSFAISKGWDRGKSLSEWTRFRDWSLNKGRKHKNLDAAWRNWVTSPYQTNGAPNVQTNQHHPGGAYGASKDRFRVAYDRLSEFADGTDEGNSSSGSRVVEILPAARRERS